MYDKLKKFHVRTNKTQITMLIWLLHEAFLVFEALQKSFVVPRRLVVCGVNSQIQFPHSEAGQIWTNMRKLQQKHIKQTKIS